MLLTWICRTAYFFVQHSPLPFKVGAIFQLSVDVGKAIQFCVQCNQSDIGSSQGILVQKLVYGSSPPATALDEEDIEQALALDAD
jgi:solute carrier family 66, member 2